VISSGRFTADELMLTLSAPAFMMTETSASELIQQPTVNGIFI